MHWQQLSKGLLVLAVAAGLAACKQERQIEDEVFYFVLPDRFANGDVSNDTGGMSGDKHEHGFDQSDKSYYHGGDLQGLIGQLPYLKKMGITSIWMTPIFKNMPTVGNSAGFHGYWTVDYTQVDPHWGSNEDLQQLIRLAHKRDMKIFFDIVINHTADVIRFEECHHADGSLKEGLSTCAYRSLEEVATNPYTPFALPGMEYAKQPEWLNNVEYYHNQGDSTFSGENSLNGDFFGLDDLKTEHPDVVAGMTDLFKYWITEYKMDGFRVDTVKHVDMPFWEQWTPAILEHAKTEGIDDFFVFGEVFEGHPKNLSRYTTQGKLPAVLDFGLYYAIRDVVAGNQGTDRLQWVFDQDDYYTDADSSAAQLLTFSGNHDVGRIGQQIDALNPNASDEERLARARLANAILYFSRGIPVVYYGDEQGFTGDGHDVDAREDMFPSQVESYNDNNLIGSDATTAQANFDRQHPLYQDLRSMAKALDKHQGLRRGDQYFRSSSAAPGILAFSRMDPTQKREYLVVFNSSTEQQSYIGSVDGQDYKMVWPATNVSVTADDQGILSLDLDPLSAVVYVSKQAVASPSDNPSLAFEGLEEGGKITGLAEISATMAHSDAVSYPGLYGVDFEVSVDGGDWQTLGSDAVAPYRIFYSTEALADGTSLVFRATTTGVSEAAQAEISLEVGAVPGMSIVFEKPSDWSSANIYWWSAEPQPDVAWPGEAMEHLGGNWYQFDFNDGVVSGNIIFNDGNGNQTSDFYRESSACYSQGAWLSECDTSIVDPEPEPVVGMTVYFQQPSDWSAPYVYFWGTSNDPQWPGNAMSDLGSGWYSYQLPAGTAASNLIFNDNNGQQTTDLYREGDGCYDASSDSWADSCVLPGLKVYLQTSGYWSDSANIFYWDVEGVAAPAWPGLAMESLGEGWFSYQMPDGVRASNLIFNDAAGTGEQTANLYREANGCFSLESGNWSETCDHP